MKKIILLSIMAIMSMTALAQRTTYKINYSYEYDQQKNDYIKKLDYCDGTVTRTSKDIVIRGISYNIVSEDMNTSNAERRSVQYTCKDVRGQEYIICFNVELTFPEWLHYQVLIFNANSPYDWTYYITDAGQQ